MPLNYTTVKDTGSQGSFKIKVPPVFLNEGTNTFKVISLPVRGKVNASSPKTFTVKVKTTKKDQVITANNLTLKVNEKKNINAKVNTNLPLTYKSTKPDIVTVDTKGNVIGRSTGTAQIVITQSGNKDYNAVTRNITVTVKDDTPDSYTITYNANGGKGSMSKKTAKSGSNIVVAKNKFKKTGYTFMGWSTSKKGKVNYDEGKIIKLNKNITLYAIWEKDIIPSKKSITNIALNLAYPLGTSKSKASYKRGKPTPEYKKALHKYYKGQHFWSDASRKGASCDVFVGTVVRSSGYDTKFPAGLGSQIRHMNSSSKWIKVKWDGKKSSLKSGDILYSKHNRNNSLNNGHIYIYVVKDGKGYIANASAKTYYGKVIKYSDRRKLKKVRYVKVFRAKNAKIR